ncbi:UNVERIFIED_CONTAM: Pentatricopeptide repeat-containing protein, chloroplastic [Sesamum radiatum]|uniref:Pentatricopeptide repeat-containing protein, chloroplastic n=1 Tax=Sesamum radiatum TaxID=300843 RepID=A0AAW2WJL7_SESRA
MKYPDLVRWTTMITSYANHGKGLEALQLFDLMEKSGTEPNDVTFVGVRSACSHTGLVGEGYFHLNSMIKDYGIAWLQQALQSTMVDLLGRACRKTRRGSELAAKKIEELQPSGAGANVSV